MWVTNLVEDYLRLKQSLQVPQPQLLFGRTGKTLTTAALRGRLSTASDDAGLSQRVTPHMLRHTAATELVEAGVDIRYVQRLLGHASLSTTEIYTHVSDHALRRRISDADILGRAFDLQQTS
jgi:integrase/recombinase XerD